MFRGWFKSQPLVFWVLLALDLILFCFVALLYTKTVFADENSLTFVVKDRYPATGVEGWLVSPIVVPMLILVPEGGAAGTAKGEILRDCHDSVEVTNIGKDANGEQVTVSQIIITCGKKTKDKYRVLGLQLKP